MKQLSFNIGAILAIVILGALAWFLLDSATEFTRAQTFELAQFPTVVARAEPSITPPALAPTLAPTRLLAPTALPTQVARQDELRFDELYKGGGARGLIFSDKLVALDNKKIDMTGFMAPPLKPALDFFVLTRVPLEMCPFCSSDTSWPEDIVFVRMPPNQNVKPTSATVRVTGRLELGTKTDQATGFVSLVRIYAERVDILR
jgi:hypothetical protein